MQEQYTWDLTDIFKTKEDFEKEIVSLNTKLEEIKNYQGKLKDSSENLYQLYNTYERALEHYRKIYGYGMLKFHLNMADTENIKLFKRCEAIGTEFSKITSYITPEITEIPNETILEFIKENDKLKRYERELKQIIKDKEHILSKQEEKLIASFLDVFNSSENTFDILTNTEFHFGEIVKKDGSTDEIV